MSVSLGSKQPLMATSSTNLIVHYLLLYIYRAILLVHRDNRDIWEIHGNGKSILLMNRTRGETCLVCHKLKDKKKTRAVFAAKNYSNK